MRTTAAAPRHAELTRRLRAGKPAAGAAGDATDHDILIVLGEALADAIIASDDPAARERRDARVGLCLQGEGDGEHSLAPYRFPRYLGLDPYYRYTRYTSPLRRSPSPPRRPANG